MSFLMVLVGVPGCGKSTVLEGVLKQIPELSVINLGDRMLEAAAAYQIDKDSLRKLPLQEQKKFVIEASKKIAMHLPKITCIDTHAMIKTPIGYCPLLPDVVAILKPAVLSIIECAPSDILERRKKDGSRNRDQESVEQIAYHQDISRNYSVSSCAATGALFAPIQNNKEPSEASHQLVKLIHSFSAGA